MNADLLTSAAPSVVMTEEAGELLEAHALASMQNSTKHLLQIGDHKQLRPKIENHTLSVVSGNGYDLNRSMFERLILGGHAHSTLQEQHRMAPEISSVIMGLKVYPELRNHSSVSNYPPLRGTNSRVVFYDHRFPEVEQLNWKVQHESKSNREEARIAAFIARYMIQQAYTEGQITILTSYLGQVVELQKALTEVVKIPVDIGEKDMRDLTSATSGIDLPVGNSGPIDKAMIRVSTIDNYQVKTCSSVSRIHLLAHIIISYIRLSL